MSKLFLESCFLLLFEITNFGVTTFSFDVIGN